MFERLNKKLENPWLNLFFAIFTPVYAFFHYTRRGVSVGHTLFGIADFIVVMGMISFIKETFPDGIRMPSIVWVLFWFLAFPFCYIAGPFPIDFPICVFILFMMVFTFIVMVAGYNATGATLSALGKFFKDR